MMILVHSNQTLDYNFHSKLPSSLNGHAFLESHNAVFTELSALATIPPSKNYVVMNYILHAQVPLDI